MNPALTVYFDGGCPLCRREIDFYRRREGSDRIQWIDVSETADGDIASGLCRTDALARFHVQRADGSLASGGAAFAEMWYALPGFRWIGRIARTRPMVNLLEAAYQGFLRFRPFMQRIVSRMERKTAGEYPRWLEQALRSNHAGETGAVFIYRGILAVTSDPDLREFSRRHMQTEARHLAVMEQLLAPARRSRLLFVWRAAGFLTGALPALFGPRTVYATVDAVETFVDHHYRAQIDALEGKQRWSALRASLDACRRDEVAHRDEARRAMKRDAGLALSLWVAMVGAGSTAGVAVARRV